MSSRSRLGGARSILLGATAVLCLFLPGTARAQANEDTGAAITALKQEIAALKQEYGQRLDDLEKRLAALEQGRAAPAQAEAAQPAPAPAETPAPPPSAETAEDSELAALRASAESAAGAPAPETAGSSVAPETTETGGTPSAPEAAVAGSERNLNRLNPEISMTGDLVGVATNRAHEDFDAREFELNVQSALDPFSMTKWTLSFTPEGGVDVEEGYVAYNNLPGGLALTAGKFRQSFGVLNRWHLHALPNVDYPLVLQSFFGEEGLAQTGLSASWLVPRPWASANEINVELTDGKNEAFGGESFRHLTALAHLKNYWDVNPATYFELGLSGAAGGPAEQSRGGDSRIYGTDLTLHWQPPARAKYRELTWRTELLRSERNSPAGVQQTAWGGYSYLEDLVAQNLYAGLRFDRVEDPYSPEHTRTGLFPNLTWWESEYVRLRGEYGYIKDNWTGNERKFTLQLTWAAGPHKHEVY
jgi:hypothetical protein